MALLLMVEHLSEVSHVHHLPARLTRIEMVSLVFGLSVHSVADNLSGLENSGNNLRVLDAVSPSFIQLRAVGSYAREADTIRDSAPTRTRSKWSGSEWFPPSG